MSLHHIAVTHIAFALAIVLAVVVIATSRPTL